MQTPPPAIIGQPIPRSYICTDECMTGIYTQVNGYIHTPSIDDNVYIASKYRCRVYIEDKQGNYVHLDPSCDKHK